MYVKNSHLANLGLNYLSLLVYCEQLATIRTLSLGSGCSPITSINSIDPTDVSFNCASSKLIFAEPGTTHLVVPKSQIPTTAHT